MRQALSVAEIDDAVLRAQRQYYDQRAPEYDDSYQRTRGHDRGAEANAARALYALLAARYPARDRGLPRPHAAETAAVAGRNVAKPKRR